jgi:hypothetical protein
VDEYRHLAETEHFEGSAAKEDPTEAAASMRSHNDKITFFFFCQLDDCIGRMLIPDAADLTVDADALSALLCVVKDAGGIASGPDH